MISTGHVVDMINRIKANRSLIKDQKMKDRLEEKGFLKAKSQYAAHKGNSIARDEESLLKLEERIQQERRKKRNTRIVVYGFVGLIVAIIIYWLAFEKASGLYIY